MPTLYPSGPTLGESIAQGVRSYIDVSRGTEESERKRKKDALQEALFQKQLLESGYKIGDEGGLIETPEGQSRKLAKKEALKRKQLLEEGEFESKYGQRVERNPETGELQLSKIEGWKPKEDLGNILKRYQIAQIQKELGGGKRLGESSALKMSEGSSVSRMLPDIQETIETNKDVFGPVSGTMSELNPYNTKAQTINAQMRAASQSFGRFMEGGVLRKEDEEKYRKMFPNLSDTPEVAKNKLRIVDRLLKKKQSADIQALAEQGYSVKGFDVGKIPESPEILRANRTAEGLLNQSKATAITPEDQQALNWARSNPRDPRAAKILQRLGI